MQQNYPNWHKGKNYNNKVFTFKLIDYFLKTEKNSFIKDKEIFLIEFYEDKKNLVKRLIDLKNNTQKEFLYETIYYGFKYQLIDDLTLKLILEYKDIIMPLNQSDKKLCSLLIYNFQNHLLKMLLDANAVVHEINSSDKNGNYPLHLAVYYFNNEAVDLLLRNNANPSVRNKENQTPLHVAAIYGNIDAAKLLLKIKPSLAKLRDNQGYNHLQLAAINGQITYLENFVNSENDLNVRDGKGNTILHLLAKINKVQYLKDLVKKIGKLSKELLDARNYENKTALEIALEKENYESVKALLELGARFSFNDLKMIRKIIKFYSYLLKESIANFINTP